MSALALHDPARHEPLTGARWDSGQAQAFVEEVVADAERAFDPGSLWPRHSLDADGGDAGPPWTGMYFGAAGVCWALAALEARCGAAVTRRWRDEARSLVVRYRAHPDTGHRVPSYFLGEVGVLAVADDAREHDELFALIESNIANPTVEALWGAPGTMLPALFLWRRTGELRWRDLWLRNARWLIEQWSHHEDAGCHLWTQDLYGEIVRLTGAGHGFAGNAFALLSGLDVLSDAERADVVSRTRQTILTTARRAEGLANWSPHVGRSRAGRESVLVQWCHGAPGMVTSVAALHRDPDTDLLLAEAGELVWRAGPLTKGPSLCHGTAGNGYAFLYLFRRTGDERWLDRARGFAMHAMEQTRDARRRHGRGRYSLWTGDLGAALFAADCGTGTPIMPTLDSL